MGALRQHRVLASTQPPRGGASGVAWHGTCVVVDIDLVKAAAPRRSRKDVRKPGARRGWVF